jgi:hypothetical protein
MLGNGLFSSKTPQSTQKEVLKKKKSKARKLAKNNSEPFEASKFSEGEKNVKIFLNSI